jgi:general secretion pathway protein I
VKNSRGFTLLEMIVATVILAVAVTGVMAGISGALRNAARLTSYDRAVQLARQRMNDLLVDDLLPRNSVIEGAFDPQQAGGLDAGWRARVTLFERPPATLVGQVGIDRIELEVWWMSGAQRRTFSLDGYRPHVLRAQDFTPAAPR